MSQRTLISFYQKKQKKDKERISNLLSGRSSTTKAKKRRAIPTSSAASIPAVAEASTSAAATSPLARERRESEMEDTLMGSVATPLTIASDGEYEESRTLPLTRARKRRRTEKGKEEWHSDGNF